MESQLNWKGTHAKKKPAREEERTEETQILVSTKNVLKREKGNKDVEGGLN